MKKTLLAVLLLIANYSFSQSLPDYSSIKMEQKSDYVEADKAALAAANYILSTPYQKNDISRLQSLQVVIKWMSGSPDFTFTLDETATKLMKGNDDILALYMVAMTKYSLENREAAADPKSVKVNAIKNMLAYCENPANNFKLTKPMQKLSDANKRGELEKAL